MGAGLSVQDVAKMNWSYLNISVYLYEVLGEKQLSYKILLHLDPWGLLGQVILN